MKRRLMALTLAVIICLSLSVNVFAAQTTGVGTSSGGSGGTLRVTTKLYVTKYLATANTNCTANVADNYFETSVTFYYTSPVGHTLSVSNTDATVVTQGEGSGTGTHGFSQHTINGGSVYGTWTGSLRANAS